MGWFARVLATPVAARRDAASGAAHGRRRRWPSLLLVLGVVATLAPSVTAQEEEEDVPLELPPGSVMVDQFGVDSRSSTGTDSTVPLVEGQTYIVEASGTVVFTGDAVADAECANFGSGDPAFERERFAVSHSADLLVDRQGLEWVPTIADAENCNTEDHTYRTFLVPQSTKAYNFLFNDGGWRGDNAGELTVRILLTDQVAPAGTEIDEFGLAADDADGENSNVALDDGRSYRLRVSGSFVFNQSESTHDAECLSVGGAPGQRADSLDDQGTTPDVVVGGEEVDWVPSRGLTGCDDTDHTYVHDVSGVAGSINLRVRDPQPSDNAGLLLVEVFDLGEASGDPAPTPLLGGGLPGLGSSPSPLPSEVLVEELVVDSRSESGATTTQRLVAGQTYLIQAGGVARFGNGVADAECAAFDLVPTWKREYFPDAPDTADLLVDGAGIEWVPTTSDGEGCNTSDHVYRTFVVPQTTKAYNFVFNDGGWRGDNSGELTVRIYATDRVPPAGTEVDSFSLSSSTPSGADSAVTLNETRSYRIRVDGTFTFNDTGALADAECVQAPAGTPGQRQDAVDDTGSTPDVLIQEQEVDWVPVQGRTGCDDLGHGYILEMSGVGSTLNLAVRDTWHGDNSGTLDVRIFDLGATTGDEPGAPPLEAPFDLPEAPTMPSGSVVVDQFTVDSRSSTGTDTTLPLVGGQTYILEAGGVVSFGAGEADPECASLPPTLPTWEREYFTSEPHTADLLVDGEGVEWAAVTPDSEGCNTSTHFYRLFYTPETTQPVNFVFNDGGWRGDNSGSLSVRVLLTDAEPPAGTLIEQFSLDSTDPDGVDSSTGFVPANAYRVQVAGTFRFTDNPTSHDAECLHAAGGPGTRQELLDEGGSTPDVLLRGNQVSWTSARGRTGCDDRTHTYFLDISGVSGVANLRVRDTWHGDNEGILNVKIFDLGPVA